MKKRFSALVVVGMAAALSAPALAQDASSDVATIKHANGGQCAISQAMLAAIEQNKQNHMTETKSRLDALIEHALTVLIPGQTAQSPVIMGKAPAGG
jgi:hypothetical protein